MDLIELRPLKRDPPMGEIRLVLRRVAKDALKVNFDRKLKLEFHGYFRFWVDLATKKIFRFLL